MEKTLQKIDINLIDNRHLFHIILNYLKTLNLNIEENLTHTYGNDFRALYLPWDKIAIILYPYNTLNFIEIAIKENKENLNEVKNLFQKISNIINSNYEDLNLAQQSIIFSIFALFHEIGHIQWSKKLYKRYAKMYNKEITEENIKDRFKKRFYKRKENCEKFKINHRDEFEEKFCNKFASLMLKEFITK